MDDRDRRFYSWLLIASGTTGSLAGWLFAFIEVRDAIISRSPRRRPGNPRGHDVRNVIILPLGSADSIPGPVSTLHYGHHTKGIVREH